MNAFILSRIRSRFNWQVFSVFLLAFAAAGTKAAETAAAVSRTSDTAFVLGRVTNKATNVHLGNVRIQVEGTNLSTLSDPSGSYLLALPPGSHTLVMSYAGLTTERVPVQVNPRQTVTRDVSLSSDVYTLEAVTVTGIREENALALQAERYAPNPKTVLATSAFGRAGANPGDLLQRMAGITADIIAGEVTLLYIRGMGADFSSLLVDGEAVASLGALSRQHWTTNYGTANLSQVELIKAPTPDQDANAIAGYVNLVTKRAFDQSGRKLNLSVGTTWTDRGLPGHLYRNRITGVEQFVLSYSEAFDLFGRKRNFGVTVDFGYSDTPVFNEEVGSVYFGVGAAYTSPATGNPLPRIFGTGDYRSINLQINAGFGVDYKFSDDSSVFIKIFSNKRNQYQEAFRTWVGNSTATLADFAPGSSTLFATLLPNASSTATVEGFTSTSKQTNYGFGLGSDHRLLDRTAKLSFRANYSYSRGINIPFSRVQAVATGIGLSIDRRMGDPWYPTIAQTAGPDIRSASSYEMRTLSRTKGTNPNELYSVRTDFEKNFALAVPAMFKAGLKFVSNPRKYRGDVANFSFAGADGQLRSADDNLARLTVRSLTLTDGRYGPFPMLGNPYNSRDGDPTLLPSNYWVQTAADIYNSYNSSFVSNMDLDERISAGYVQGNLQLGRLRILAGIRMERTDNEGTAWLRNQTASWGGNSVGGASLDPAVVSENLSRAQRSFVGWRTTKSDYEHFFPGVHFIHEPREGWLVRSSYNRSISRPPIGAILPTISENAENLTLTAGNPDLRPYTSDNFEVGTEKYFEPVGKFGVSVFLKEIKNYSRSISIPLGSGGLDGSGQYANYTLTRSMNVGNARVRGFEISYQQQFSYLPGFWKGWGLFANYTYLETLGNFGTLVTSTKLPLLAPRSGNAGLSYVNKGLQLRAMANWRDRVFAGTSVFDYDREERLILDFKAQYTFGRRYDFFFEVFNAGKEPTSADVAAPNMYRLKLTPGAAYTAGINARF